MKISIAPLALAAALCAAPAIAQEKITLRFANTFDAAFQELWKPVITQFEKLNPMIQVKIESTAGSGAAIYPDVLRTSMVTGAPPDVFFMWGGTIAAPFMKSGQARVLDDEYTKFGWDGRFAAPIKARSTTAGKTYGVPYRAMGMAFWYRSDIAEKLKIKLPNTVAELEQNCATLKTAGIYCASTGGKFGWHTGRLTEYFIETTCGPDRHDKLNALAESWDQPCVVAGFQRLRTWIDKGWLVPYFLAVAPNDSRIPVYQGRAFMIFEGGWLEGALKASDQNVQNYSFFVPPNDSANRRYSGFGEQWMIATNTKHPSQAAAFINFITDPAVQSQFKPGTFPLSASIGAKVDCAVTPMECKWKEVISSNMGSYLPTDQYFDKELIGSFYEIQDGIVAGKVTPVAAAKLFQERVVTWKSKQKS